MATDITTDLNRVRNIGIMSAHVVVEDSVTAMDDAHGVLDRLRGCLAEHFDVEHSTFQIEPAGHVDSENHVHH